MLGYLFGFNARIGRVPFALATFALGVGFVMLVNGVTGTPPGNGRMDVLLAQATNSDLILVSFFAALAINFMLQSMRVRDIGWDPASVMVCWIALVAVDKVAAGKFPDYALTYQHTGTTIGALANLAWMLALLAWPSSGSSREPQPYDQGSTSEGYWRKAPEPTGNTSRISRVANGDFGGRK